MDDKVIQTDQHVEDKINIKDQEHELVENDMPED